MLVAMEQVRPGHQAGEHRAPGRGGEQVRTGTCVDWPPVAGPFSAANCVCETVVNEEPLPAEPPLCTVGVRSCLSCGWL